MCEPTHRTKIKTAKGLLSASISRLRTSFEASAPDSPAVFSKSMRGYPVGTGPGWLATNQRAITPIASTTMINPPVRVHMRASLPFTRESRR